jgi:hypothetical protein
MLLALVVAGLLAVATPAVGQTRYELRPAQPGPSIYPPDRYTIGPSGPGSSLLAPPTLERARPNESLMTPQYEIRPAPSQPWGDQNEAYGFSPSRRR